MRSSLSRCLHTGRGEPGGVAPSIPDLILFVPIAGGTVILTALSASLLLKGPRPRRLPNELILAGDGFRLCYPDGGEVSVSWGKENLWLQLSKARSRQGLGSSQLARSSPMKEAAPKERGLVSVGNTAECPRLPRGSESMAKTRC